MITLEQVYVRVREMMSCPKLSKVALSVHSLCILNSLFSTTYKVKVSYSLIALGAVGVRVPLYFRHGW